VCVAQACHASAAARACTMHAFDAHLASGGGLRRRRQRARCRTAGVATAARRAAASAGTPAARAAWRRDSRVCVTARWPAAGLVLAHGQRCASSQLKMDLLPLRALSLERLCPSGKTASSPSFARV
jgi:hypothetical protein